MNSARGRVQEWLGTSYMRIGRKIWWRLPAWAQHLPPVRWYGIHLHAVVRKTDRRDQNHSTLFFRNRAELTLLTRLMERKEAGGTLKMAVMGCSKGAEVYSIMAAIRLARPDLKVSVCGVDVSEDILKFAKEGVYSLAGADEVRSAVNRYGTESEIVAYHTTRDQRGLSLFERVTPIEMEVMFERDGDRARVKSWLSEGISWHCGSAEDPKLVSILGHQDVVVANRFLCHMAPAAAESCLRNLARLVKPGGYLFASGVDLDVREKVAKEMGWEPVEELMKDVYEGDRTLTDGWPTEYWAIEPFKATQRNWMTRYSSAFRLGVNACLMWADNGDGAIAWTTLLS